MRLVQSAFVFCLLLSSGQVWGQQTQSTDAAQTASKDSQAVSILNQALNAAGGVQVFGTIKDYTATGNMTLHQGTDVSVAVTVRSNGLNDFRIDQNTPAGMRSQVVRKGLLTRKTEEGFVKPFPYYQAPMGPGGLLLPYWELRIALLSQTLSITNQGTAQLDGQSVYVVRIQLVHPGMNNPHQVLREYGTLNFFIDPSTLHVVMMQDIVGKNLHRQVRYSDFRPVNGVQVPFSISEEIFGQNKSLIQLDGISFNSGLQDSDFQL